MSEGAGSKHLIPLLLANDHFTTLVFDGAFPKVCRQGNSMDLQGGRQARR